MGDPRTVALGERMEGENTDAGAEKQQKPRLLLMGLKRFIQTDNLIVCHLLIICARSGKTSISNVVFRGMLPQNTLYLPTTTAIEKQMTQ